MTSSFTFPWGRIESATAQPSPHGNRAHDWRGRTYRWSPLLPGGHRTAFDAEHLDTPVPEFLRPPEMTPRDFFAAWTHAEALAKFFDVPILAWLRQHPLASPDFGSAQLSHEAGKRDVLTFTELWPAEQIVFTCAYAPNSTVPIIA